MSNKNEVFEYQIDQLRQQVGNNPYKQQCEDLAHEVQSLKNRLRDMSEVVDELMGTITLMNGGVEAYKVLRKGGYGSEQYSCSGDATQVRDSWIEHGACPVPDDAAVDIKFRNGKVESNTKALWWSWGTKGGPYEIVAYRAAKPGCEHDWYFYDKGASMMCKKCGLKK